MCSEQCESEIVNNRLQAITYMPAKITKNVQFLMIITHITNGLQFIGILILVLSRSYFAQHLFSNGKIRSTRRGRSY